KSLAGAHRSRDQNPHRSFFGVSVTYRVGDRFEVLLGDGHASDLLESKARVNKLDQSYALGFDQLLLLVPYFFEREAVAFGGRASKERAEVDSIQARSHFCELFVGHIGLELGKLSLEVRDEFEPLRVVRVRNLDRRKPRVLADARMSLGRAFSYQDN